MLATQTIEGLHALRLSAMARGLLKQRERPDYEGLSFEERLGLLVDREITERQGRRLERNLKQAKLRTQAAVEDVDFRRPRGLDRAPSAQLGRVALGGGAPQRRDRRRHRARQDLPRLRARPLGGAPRA